MDIQTIKNIATRAVSLTVLRAQKHSPTILTAVGIVSGVASTVLACKATLKLEPIVEELEEHLEIVKQTDHVDTRARAMDLGYVYTRKSLEIARLYAPAATLGVVSIVCVVSGQGIMQRRNAALVGAYAALERGFNEYRKRVEEFVGPEKEQELRYAIREEEVHDTKKGVVEKVQTVDPNGISVYARFFDELSPNWAKTPEYNMLFIKAQQNYANDLLKSRGHVFLNDVYDMLGIPRSSAGSVVGWVLSKNGDNFIDFGLYRGNSPAVREFVNGQERSILLDFNVDGVIYDKI